MLTAYFTTVCRTEFLKRDTLVMIRPLSFAQDNGEEVRPKTYPWATNALRVKVSALGCRWPGWKWIATYENWANFFKFIALENLLKL